MIGNTLSDEAADALELHGFVVLPGPFSREEFPLVQAAYDRACANADPVDVGVGRTSTRVTDFVNRGAVFDSVYTWAPALDAARRVINAPFRLSAFHARTLHPGASAQELHTDVPRTSDAWPMLGVILMIDEFRPDNGATRFVAGSHRGDQGGTATAKGNGEWETTNDNSEWKERMATAEGNGDRGAAYACEALACGPAGSVILFNASTWHGHSANSSPTPRRSLQATFIPRTGRPATDFLARMHPETFHRLNADARYLIGAE